jgi:hypothetical protein
MSAGPSFGYNISVTLKSASKKPVSHLYLFSSSRAKNLCRVAHPMTSSGAIRANTITRVRSKNFVIHPISGSGMFGWIATQVHANMVARQLQTILLVVRVGRSLVATRVWSSAAMGSASLAKGDMTSPKNSMVIRRISDEAAYIVVLTLYVVYVTSWCTCKSAA